jgi:hypothetical protein
MQKIAELLWRRTHMNSRLIRLTLGLILAAVPAFVSGCGGAYGSGSPGGGGAQYGNVNMMVSDASTEDWATIGVKILSISLTPQGGGAPVSVYTAPNPVPTTNLVQLDQLGEILGNASVPVGTYTGAILTVSGNPADILLTAAANPEAGFAGTAGATIPPAQIQVQGTTGSAGSLTVPVNVTFDSPLVVTANQSNALDLEFDLSHPAFLVAHVPPAAGMTVWAVNFRGPLRHHPLPDITRLVLRHTYGTVASVASNNASITITKDFPVEPPTNPETAIATTHSLSILADAANGTIFYDVDAKTNATIKDFSTLAMTLPNKFVRVAARYQSDGSLVAVRIWASSTFNSVWISPEGHVLHVNTGTNVITVENEVGGGVPLTVDANTQFFYRTPWNAVADTTPIGTGPAFLAAKNLVRGFKVHASVVDPLASPLVAQTVDIEIARYDGVISLSNLNNFTYTRNFFLTSDNYSVILPYISQGSANGKDPLTGAPITGFKWWNFTFPTLLNSGMNAVNSFETATNGGVNFGNSLTFSAWGETFATWGDPNNLTGWDAPWTVLVPTPVPLGTAATGYVNGSPTGSFTMTIPGGTLAVTVDLTTTSGSGTLVYQVDRTGAVVTISPVDITTTAGQATLTTNLIATTPVKVYGVPQASGSIKAYLLIYFTGTIKPAAAN